MGANGLIRSSTKASEKRLKLRTFEHEATRAKTSADALLNRYTVVKPYRGFESLRLR